MHDRASVFLYWSLKRLHNYCGSSFQALVNVSQPARFWSGRCADLMTPPASRQMGPPGGRECCKQSFFLSTERTCVEPPTTHIANTHKPHELINLHSPDCPCAAQPRCGIVHMDERPANNFGGAAQQDIVRNRCSGWSEEAAHHGRDNIGFVSRVCIDAGTRSSGIRRCSYPPTRRGRIGSNGVSSQRH